MPGTTVYAIVDFTYPEGDNYGEFDSVIGVYFDKTEAEVAAREHSDLAIVVPTTLFPQDA